MSSDARTKIEAIMTAIEALGYALSDDQFTFDAVPSSKMDQRYRLEVGTGEVVDVSGRRVEKRKDVEVWAAYKITAKGDRKDAFLDVLDSQEALEDALMDAIPTSPSVVVASVLSKYVQNYIVLHVTFQVTYWRDLT